MDPNLFHLDWAQTAEALAGVIVLSFVVERVAALIFESRLFVRSTKIPQDDSPEADLERQALDQSVRIREITESLERDEDIPHDKFWEMVAALRPIADDLTPRNLLWPLDPTDPKACLRQANLTLATLEERQFRRRNLGALPIKELFAFVLAAFVCLTFDFDILGIILKSEQTSFIGALITAGVIAGGSKASIKLFHDVIGARSGALDAVRDLPKDDRRRAGRS